MQRALLTLFLLGLAMPAALGADADPQSNACQRALAALQTREAELAAAARADTPARIPTDARWQALRGQAARDCLGRDSAASAPPGRLAQPPVVVPPVVVPPAPAETAQRRSPPPLAAPSPSYKPPVTVMSCDPLGCWTSDGARLPHTGRNPLDARVRCSVQGRMVVCL
jgi:hypothetical protein